VTSRLKKALFTSASYLQVRGFRLQLLGGGRSADNKTKTGSSTRKFFLTSHFAFVGDPENGRGQLVRKPDRRQYERQ
jgi:hypothetical protein